MNNKKEQIPATKAIAEIKEQVQLDRWKKDIENRQAAGLSIAAYCEQQGISKTTYYYRLRKVREHLSRSAGLLPELPSDSSIKQQVVPIRMGPEIISESRVEIVSGDLRISFVGETSPSALRAVIEALRSC